METINSLLKHTEYNLNQIGRFPQLKKNLISSHKTSDISDNILLTRIRNLEDQVDQQQKSFTAEREKDHLRLLAEIQNLKIKIDETKINLTDSLEQLVKSQHYKMEALAKAVSIKLKSFQRRFQRFCYQNFDVEWVFMANSIQNFKFFWRLFKEENQ